jgi:hypothetical protein
MTIRNDASVFPSGTSEKRKAQKGKPLSEPNEAKGEAFDVAVSGEVKPGTDTSRVEALDNNANNLSHIGFRQLRASRYERRNALWSISSIERVRACGRVRVAHAAGIKIVDGRASYSGLATCGSVWACPVCSSKIMTFRNVEVKTAIDRWAKADKSFVFQTLTMRHSKGQSLKELWEGLSYAWQRLNSGATSKRETAKYGQVGFLRVVELTHGKNGWHIHIHLLRFLDMPLTDEQAKEWAEAQYKRWAKALTDKGLATPLRSGQDFKLTRNADDLAKYLTKQANYGGKLDKELTSSFTKKAKQGGRKPFEILEDLITNPTGEDASLWFEFEQVSQGKKQTHWSNGLRELLGLNEELSDEEQAAKDAAVSVLPLICITDKGLRTLGSNRRWQHQALTIAEISGLQQLEEFFTDIGVETVPTSVMFPEDKSLDDFFELQGVLDTYATF